MCLKKLLLSLAILCGFAIEGTNAQALVVTGKITSSADQKSILGASVLEKGTSNGVSTDQDGNFRISVSSPKAVLVSLIGD